MSKYQKNWWKLLTKKIFISSEQLEEFQLNFEKKMFPMIILKVTKNQGFALSLENAVLEKPQSGESNWLPKPFKG